MSARYPTHLRPPLPKPETGEKARLAKLLGAEIARIEGRRLTLSESEEIHVSALEYGLFQVSSIPGQQPPRLAPDGLHEILPETPADLPAALSFGLLLVLWHRRRLERAGLRRRAGGTVLWCQSGFARAEAGRPYLPSLLPLGLPPERLLFLNAKRDEDVLWALEEGARTGLLLAVLGEVARVSLTGSRRLQLAALEGKTPLFLLPYRPTGDPSAATTRWRIRAAPSRPNPLDAKAPGRPVFHAALFKARGGRPGAWSLEFDHEAHSFHLADALADRPAPPALAAKRRTAASV